MLCIALPDEREFQLKGSILSYGKDPSAELL